MNTLIENLQNSDRKIKDLSLKVREGDNHFRKMFDIIRQSMKYKGIQAKTTTIFENGVLITKVED